MSTLLLDTNAWLWMAAGANQLGPVARRLIDDPDTDLVLSAVSVWEVCIKWSLGKLTLPVSPTEFVDATTTKGGLRRLPIEFEHVLRVASLPPIHHDPFDRLLIAQSQCTGMGVLTGDAQLERYGVAVVDARS